MPNLGNGEEGGFIMGFTKFNNSILKSVCIVLVVSSVMFESCNESKSNSRNSEEAIPERPIKTEEQIAAENLQYEKDEAEVKSKIENKLSKLNYKAISSPHIRLFQGGAETYTPVKKVTNNFEYDAESNTITNSEELGDKVFSMEILFKKYSEYEITSVRLIDEANMLYWDLE
jgi:hypothetical protein